MRSRRNEKAAARRKLLTQGRIIFEEKNDHDQVLVGGFSVQNAQNTGLRVMFGIFFDHHFILSLLSLLNHGGFVKHVGGFMAQTCLGCGGSNSTSGPPGPQHSPALASETRRSPTPQGSHGVAKQLEHVGNHEIAGNQVT